MLATVISSSVIGIDGVPIRVEVDAAYGLPSFAIVGLPDASVRESRERIFAALRNSHLPSPSRRITINLAPADIKKEGSLFDLPMTLGILAAMGHIPMERLRTYLVMGELSLSGKVRKVKGVLPSTIMAKREKLVGVMVPEANYKEASIVDGMYVYGVSSLKQAVDFCCGEDEALFVTNTLQSIVDTYTIPDDLDLKDVKGQAFAKRALEIAAAGGHNLLMIGPPGSGKTMLAKRLPTILPPMDIDEALETTKVHSVAGTIPTQMPLITTRPFRSPHHTISDVALIGGGTFPRPGEVSLAHNGVLFLDELPEFHRNALEVLRQPLEDAKVVIARATQTLTYPAKIMFIAAMNPCPCGYFGSRQKECMCTPFQIQKYMGKISGPLWDRIDLHIDVPQISFDELHTKPVGEDSKTVRERVCNARAKQRARFKQRGIYTNAEMGTQALKEWCALDADSSKILERAVVQFNLSARAYTRILKVARTIADLDASEHIMMPHIMEAVQYRTLDRNTMTRYD